MAEEEKKAAVERKPRGRKPKSTVIEEVPKSMGAQASEATVEGAPKRTTRARKPKTEASEGAQKSADAQASEAVAEHRPKRTTRGRRPKTEASEDAQKSVDTGVTEESRPKRPTRARKVETEELEGTRESMDMQTSEVASVAEGSPKRPTRVRKLKTEELEGARESMDMQTSEAASVEDGSPKRPTRARKPEEGLEIRESGEESAPKRPTRGRKPKTEGVRQPATTDAVEMTLSKSTEVQGMEAAAASENAGAVVAADGRTAAAVAAPAQDRAAVSVEKTDELDNETQKAPSGNPCGGILEVMPDGFGFTRSDNFMPGDCDVYVNPAIIKRYRLKTGDVIHGLSRAKNPNERYAALSYIETVNGKPLSEMFRRRSFESLTPIFPNQRIRLEVPGEKTSTSLRILDLLAPIGKGQRGMIVSPPKAGKTTLLKQVAKAIVKNEPKMHLLILLIDERPEEVTDMKEEVEGGLVTVIYSTFDEVPEHHKRVAEMTIERAKRLVEQGEDVTILLDSITRLARAYNLVVPASGRTLSGGLDPAALHMPKRFFGAARNMREGGSLTILSTALVETGSRMDDVIYEEFKGTGNMELVLNRELQERRIFPAIDIVKSGTRRDDLLLSELEQRAVDIIHKRVSDEKASSAEEVIQLFERTSSNEEVCQFVVNGKPISSSSARMSSGTQKTGVKPGSNPNSRLAIKINR